MPDRLGISCAEIDERRLEAHAFAGRSPYRRGWKDCLLVRLPGGHRRGRVIAPDRSQTRMPIAAGMVSGCAGGLPFAACTQGNVHWFFSLRRLPSGTRPGLIPDAFRGRPALTLASARELPSYLFSRLRFYFDTPIRRTTRGTASRTRPVGSSGVLLCGWDVAILPRTLELAGAQTGPRSTRLI